jgi:hypothetical protein
MDTKTTIQYKARQTKIKKTNTTWALISWRSCSHFQQ